jgi:hypothetical protein
MGSNLIRDNVYVTGYPVYDPIGPIKLEAFDTIFRNVLEQFARRLEVIENHLEQGEGKAFIRSGERPDLGGALLRDLSESIRGLNERLDRLETRGE